MGDNIVLKQALQYHDRGWSIIPTGGDKKPPKGFRWKAYQKKKPNEKQLRKWFGDGKHTSLAVICGAVSGGLAVLDLDSEQRCQWWRDTLPELAKTLPTAKTRKGLHVYFRSEPFKKQNGDEMDLLCEGAYAILPPSPEKSWLIPLNGELPLLNPFDWGLEQFAIKRPQKDKNFTEETEETKEPEETEDIERHRSHSVVGVKELSAYDSDVVDYVKLAIEKTIPHKMHTRNSGIFQFCRWLKGNKEMKDLKAAELKPIIRLWWERAYDHIYTKSFTVTYGDFVHGWKRVKWPYGSDTVVQQAIRNALATETILPELQQYADEPDIIFFGTILHELQELVGNEPIFLASRKAGGIIGTSHTEICTWYEMLAEDGILRKVKDHTSKTADRYRYVA